MKQTIDMVWKKGVGSGRISVNRGVLDGMQIMAGEGKVEGDRFEMPTSTTGRLQLDLTVRDTEFAHEMTTVTVAWDEAAFTFQVADVSSDVPILIPEYEVAVFPGNTGLTYEDALQRAFKRSGVSAIRRVEDGAEPTWEEALERCQDFPCETILGLTRDQRTFNISEDMEKITVSRSIAFRDRVFEIPIGRGRGPRVDLKRRLDDGVLPILLGTKIDGDIVYEMTVFPTLIGKPLTADNVEGTHFLIAEHGRGMAHTPAQEAARLKAEKEMSERPPTDVMLCYEMKATNTAKVPRPGFFYTPNFDPMRPGPHLDLSDEGALISDGKTYGVVRFNGGVWPIRQISRMIKPGETVSAEYRLFHRPVEPGFNQDEHFSVDDVWRQSFTELLSEARDYWKHKLDQSARINLPDPRLDEMVRAGFLHLDLLTYGKKGETLAPCVGVYSPIGSESAPIIQFYDSYGRPDLARRSLQYFLDKQHPDGFMQNFGGYMLETGAVLWSMGEHYRYTRDDEWVAEIAPKLKLSADWIMKRRQEDTVDPKAPGAGMIAGKVADPEDAYRIFMLNGYHYIGLQRVAEMLANVDPDRAAIYADDAARYKEDIRRALKHSMVISPVVPLGDGRWIPSCAPWVESTGYNAMALTGEHSYTHSSVFARDSLLGALYLVFTEVLDIDEIRSSFLIDGHYEWMCQEGIAFSQPFYSRHAELHLRRGERKAFLKAVYNGVAGLVDRETHTFWEHHYGVSPHKTHEEGWFLMQLRWMLYREEGSTLNLLSGCSRRDFADGKRISVGDVRSYFGPLDIEVSSTLSRGSITATVRCPEGKDRGLSDVRLHVFHPDGKRAVSVTGGTYDAATESVVIDKFQSETTVTLHFS